MEFQLRERNGYGDGNGDGDGINGTDLLRHSRSRERWLTWNAPQSRDTRAYGNGDGDGDGGWGMGWLNNGQRHYIGISI